MDEDKLLEKATSLAFRFLSYRPRSESEVRRRLEAKYPRTGCRVGGAKADGAGPSGRYVLRPRVDTEPCVAQAPERQGDPAGASGQGRGQGYGSGSGGDPGRRGVCLSRRTEGRSVSGGCRLQHLSTSSLGLPLPPGLQPGRHPQNREPIVGGEGGLRVSGVRSGIAMSIGGSRGASFSAHGEPVEPIEREQSSRSAHALR